MQNLEIQETNNTPGVKLDAIAHKIGFFGESRPDNIKIFYEPIFNWIADYKKYLFRNSAEFKQEIVVFVNFKMEYFNSSTVIAFNELLLELKKMSEENKLIKLTINWYYEAEDTDMMDAGNEFSDMAKLKINVIPY